MIQSQVRLPSSIEGSQSPTWTNAANMLIDDGVLAASPPVLHQGMAPFLKLTNFGFSFPDDATVIGIVLRVEGRNEINTRTGFHCVGVSSGTGSGGLRLLGIDGAIGKPMTSLIGNQLTTKIVGGDVDLWGALSIPVEKIKSNEFGIYAAFRNGNTTTQKMFLDKIEVEVFFDDNQPEPPIGGNGPVKPT